ncbi:MAG TPA: Hpt domain-containing protein [Terracidiphilus sp.]|jgi:HPt (histidine-containing phosphotransfer) domain-containing protein
MTNSDAAALEKYVNMPELLARVENDRELLEDLLMLFREDFPLLRDDLHAAVGAGNPAEVQKVAHTLKGMLANLSINRAAQLAADIEAAARAGETLGIQQAIAAFDREETGLLAAVNTFMVSGER